MSERDPLDLAMLQGAAPEAPELDRVMDAEDRLRPQFVAEVLDAVDAGDAVAGCTVHLVTAELDGGPILADFLATARACRDA